MNYNPLRSLRATLGSVAISFFPTRHEIASVVLLPRNDFATQSLMRERVNQVKGKHFRQLKQLLKVAETDN
jgi:hypothetical protein